MTSFLCRIVFVLGALALVGRAAAAESPAAGIADHGLERMVLSTLALDEPGLEPVRLAQAAGDIPRAMAELLAYYRRRTTVKHPGIHRQDRAAALHGPLSARDRQLSADGLKHRFIGQPAYPPDDRGEDIDWARNPQKDAEWLWQLHRLDWWEAYGRTYWATGDEAYAEEWAYELVDWVAKNLNDPQHAYAWRTIDAGIRGQRFAAVTEYFLDSPAFTPQVLSHLLVTCYEHAQHLMARRGSNNWLLIESSGLLAIATHFPEFADAKAWRQEAIARFSREIAAQVHPDGMQRELSLSYHLGTINDFWNALELAQVNGLEAELPAGYRASVERMQQAVVKLSLPDRTLPQFGDSWKGGPRHALFRQWYDRFPDPHLLWLATEGKEGKPWTETAFALPQAGLYSLRSDWTPQAVMLALKCGGDGGFHCQPDNNTFEFAALGRHFMADSGSYIYSGDPPNRAWFRRTAAHQTLTLDDLDTRYAPKLLLWKPGPDLDTLVTENDGYTTLTHRRHVFLVRRRWVVLVDDAIGPATGQLALHFQLLPGKSVSDPQALAVRTDLPGPNLLVAAGLSSGIGLRNEEGRVSFQYTIQESRPAFAFTRTKTGPQAQRFITVLAPYATGMPVVSVEQPTGLPGGSDLGFTLVVDGERTQVACVLPAPRH